ncbi:VWA domain-containing protein [Rossellomorea marisflavi]|uniref:VWA domain-containing protein n=1 Tax=Rossellomorea marisflavi TaxID=189381 RepID=UPI00345A24F0
MRKYLYLLFVLSIILTGCSNENQKADPSKQQNQSEKKINHASKEKKADAGEEKSSNRQEFYSNIPELPSSPADVTNQLPGKYAAKPLREKEWESKILEEMDEAPPLPEQPTEEELDQYFRYIYSLVKEDFPDPQEVLKKWEFNMFGSPEASDERYQFKDNYNIEIILDASGSMQNKVDGKTQMELAKDAINKFLSSAPKDANVSLRVYGHKGTGSDADKEESCSSIEQVYGFEQYDEETFDQALNSFEPKGWTPIEGALKESQKALSQFDAEMNTNLIYLVSDGVETCDGDPVSFAKEFADSNIKPIVNVIGFNVDAEAKKQLQSVSDNTNGIYTTVTNSEQLEEEFNRAKDVLESWERWKDDALRDSDAKRVDGSFDILSYTNDFYSVSLSQDLNISALLDGLVLNKKITYEIEKELRSRKRKMEEFIKQAKEEVDTDLQKAKTEKVETLKEEINEKYNQETTN